MIEALVSLVIALLVFACKLLVDLNATSARLEERVVAIGDRHDMLAETVHEHAHRLDDHAIRIVKLESA